MKYHVRMSLGNRTWTESGISMEECIALKLVYGDAFNYYAIGGTGESNTMLPFEKIDKELNYLTTALEEATKLVEQYNNIIIRLKEYKKLLTDNQ